jgi:hypothetical protein
LAVLYIIYLASPSWVAGAATFALSLSLSLYSSLLFRLLSMSSANEELTANVDDHNEPPRIGFSLHVVCGCAHPIRSDPIRSFFAPDLSRAILGRGECSRKEFIGLCYNHISMHCTSYLPTQLFSPVCCFHTGTFTPILLSRFLAVLQYVGKDPMCLFPIVVIRSLWILSAWYRQLKTQCGALRQQLPCGCDSCCSDRHKSDDAPSIGDVLRELTEVRAQLATLLAQSRARVDVAIREEGGASMNAIASVSPVEGESSAAAAGSDRYRNRY